MRLAALLAGACLLAACGSQAATPVPSSSAAAPSPTPTPAPTSSAIPPAAQSHVFVIVMENRSYSQLIGDSYIAGLAARYAVATNYHGVSHPSLPHYLALTSGSTWGITDDGYQSLPAGGLGAQLSAARIPWRAYMEGMASGCFHSPYPYALKHNPFAYYGGACPSEVVPFTGFAADLGGDVPRFVWITPDLCHDGHDCSSAVAETWLAQVVPQITATRVWSEGGVLLITWDEGEDSANSVLTLVIHPNPVIHQSARPYNHYSLLATIEDLLGVPRLGSAAQATPMTDLMESVSLPPLGAATNPA